jgi:hypothetical protein
MARANDKEFGPEHAVTLPMIEKYATGYPAYFDIKPYTDLT